VHAEGNRQLKLTHEERLGRSIDALVSAWVWFHDDHTAYRARKNPDQLDPFPDIAFRCATVLADTDSLYVHDANTDTLRAVDWFILSQTFHVRGTVVHALVDFVRAPVVSAMQARFRESRARLVNALELHAGAIEDYAWSLRPPRTAAEMVHRRAAKQRRGKS
jgi:hypothetical protein